MDYRENMLAIERYAEARPLDRRSVVIGSTLLAAAVALNAASPKSAFATVPEGLTVTLPGTLNYKIRADGTLIGPSSEALKIVNGTNGVEIRVVSVKATAGSGVTLVQDSSSSSATNALEFSIGPSSEKVNLANATNGSGYTVTDEVAWTMAAPDMNESLSEIQLEATGSIANFDPAAMRTQTQAASIDWYLANDTLTDEILDRTKTFEDVNEELTGYVEDLYALLTASEAMPREVYVQAPVNGTITVDTTPACWLNTENGRIYFVTD